MLEFLRFKCPDINQPWSAQGRGNLFKWHFGAYEDFVRTEYLVLPKNYTFFIIYILKKFLPLLRIASIQGRMQNVSLSAEKKEAKTRQECP